VKFIGDRDEDGNIINGVKRTVWFVVVLQIGFCAIGVVLAEYIEVHPYVAPVLGVVGFGLIFVLVYVVFTSMKKTKQGD
jgi:vacuolar-type H+-ATPase subunit I/STV1